MVDKDVNKSCNALTSIASDTQEGAYYERRTACIILQRHQGVVLT